MAYTGIPPHFEALSMALHGTQKSPQHHVPADLRLAMLQKQQQLASMQQQYMPQYATQDVQQIIGQGIGGPSKPNNAVVHWDYQGATEPTEPDIDKTNIRDWLRHRIDKVWHKGILSDLDKTDCCESRMVAEQSARNALRSRGML